jgi:hypothetical protein
MIPDDRLEDLLHRLAEQDPVAPQGFEVIQARLDRTRHRRRTHRRIYLAGAVAVAVVAAGLALSVGPDTRSQRVRLLPAGVPSPTVTPGPASPGRTAGPDRPGALAVAPNGNVYVADAARHQILERLADGTFVVVAGTGHVGFSGDGGPATLAALSSPAGMTFAPDGTLYLADSGNNRIRKISSTGVISTVAGNGAADWVPDGTPPLRAALGDPNDVVIGPGGALYIAAGASNEILRLGPSGGLTIVAGNKTYGGSYGIGGPAATASPDGPSGLAFDAAGNLYIFGFSDKSLLVITPAGTMTEPVPQTFYPRGDGGVRSAPDGSVVAMNADSIVRLSPTGTRTIVDFTAHPVTGVSHFQPNGIAIGPGGEIYTDTFEGNGYADKSALVKIDGAAQQSLLWMPGTAAGSPAATPAATPAGPVLGPDDLGVVRAREEQAAAVAGMTQVLGPPTSTTPGTCPGTTEVQWNDLSLEFASGSFAGYRYLKGGLAAVGSTSPPSPGPGTPLLKTAAGATLGTTLAQVRPLYPSDAFSAEQGGRIAVAGARAGDRLFLGFFDQAPTTPLTEIKGGSPCGDF